MELNVLVEAKKEYLNQLCVLMYPHMIEVFDDMYKEADKLSKGRRILLQYQKLLKEVPNWNDTIIKNHTNVHVNSCSWFKDLLAAVFVSFVKILSSIRLKMETKKMTIKLPSNELFVHSCYINVAKDLYKDPFVFQDELSEYERDEKLTVRFKACIEATVKDLIPMQQILQTYMTQEATQVDVDNAEIEDTEDPDVDDEPMPETEAELEPEPVPDADAEPIPEETKEIPVLDPAPEPEPEPESENLFDDAIDEEKKP
jgi:hypothetical protein